MVRNYYPRTWRELAHAEWPEPAEVFVVREYDDNDASVCQMEDKSVPELIYDIVNVATFTTLEAALDYANYYEAKFKEEGNDYLKRLFKVRKPITLLATRGHWFDLIVEGTKRFDFRKGDRDIRVGDTVIFKEADEDGKATGKEFSVTIDLVVTSFEFPPHFGWKGPPFTIIHWGGK